MATKKIEEKERSTATKAKAAPKKAPAKRRVESVDEMTLGPGAILVTQKDLGVTEDQRADIRKEGFSQYIRAHLLNRRQGTVACKGRSDVAFSNKKPWKQKGTGRARAGTRRSPLWRKGGVIFGPQERTRTAAISKHLKRQVCNELLWNFLENKKIIALDWIPQETPKTAHAYDALKKAGLHTKDIVLFVTPNDRTTQASFANIANIRSMLLFDQWNAYDLSNGDVWVIMQKDMDAFKEMVSSWI